MMDLREDRPCALFRLTSLTSSLSKSEPKQSFDRHIPFDFSRIKALLSGYLLGERN
jgi:hypothetical protein